MRPDENKGELIQRGELIQGMQLIPMNNAPRPMKNAPLLKIPENIFFIIREMGSVFHKRGVIHMNTADGLNVCDKRMPESLSAR